MGRHSTPQASGTLNSYQQQAEKAEVQELEYRLAIQQLHEAAAGTQGGPLGGGFRPQSPLSPLHVRPHSPIRPQSPNHSEFILG